MVLFYLLLFVNTNRQNQTRLFSYIKRIVIMYLLTLFRLDYTFFFAKHFKKIYISRKFYLQYTSI